MRFWFSPFELEPKLHTLLSDWGLHHDVQGRQPAADLLLLYDAPHTLALQSPPGTRVADLVQGYQELTAKARNGSVAVAISRLKDCHPDAIRAWLSAGIAPESPARLADASPFEALVTLTLLELRPVLLESYLDLELHAELLGGSLDSDYLARLRGLTAAVDPDVLLDQCHEPMRAASQWDQQQRGLEQSLAEREARILALEQAMATETQAMRHAIRQAHVELEQTFLTCQRSQELGRQCQVQLQRAERLLLQLS